MARRKPIVPLLIVLLVLCSAGARTQTSPSSSRGGNDTSEQKCVLFAGMVALGSELYENRGKSPENIVDEWGASLKEQYARQYELEPKAAGNQASNHKQYYIYAGPKGVKAVALTYDDGPNQRFTPRLAQLLEEKGVAATFFFLGEQVSLFPDVAREVAQAGFEIGNHSYSHRSLSKIAVAEASEEIDKTQRLIIDATGVTPRLLRPPYGECNADVTRLARERGLKLIFWTVDTDDYQRKSTKEDIVEKVVREVSNGAIILMHDRNTKTIEATEVLIDRLASLGYKFYAVSDLLALSK